MIRFEYGGGPFDRQALAQDRERPPKPLQEGCSCKKELDGADGFTFEEFSIGSDTEGF
jgi:hypothetical protein